MLRLRLQKLQSNKEYAPVPESVDVAASNTVAYSMWVQISPGVLSTRGGIGRHIGFKLRRFGMRVRISSGVLSPNDEIGIHAWFKIRILSVQIRFRVLCRCIRVGTGACLRSRWFNYLWVRIPSPVLWLWQKWLMHRIVAPDYAGPNPVGHIMHYIRNEVLYEK